MNKCSLSKNPHLICNHFILSRVSCFGVKASWWCFSKGVFPLSYLCLAGNLDVLLDDITGLVGIFLLPELDESQCFQRVIWGQGFRQNYDSILFHMDTFFFPHCIHMDTLFFPHCIVMTQRVFQFFLSLVYLFQHIRNMWMLVFVKLKSMSQGTIGFFHIILYWRLIKNQEQYNAIHHPTLPEIIEKLVEWIIHYVSVWRLSNCNCLLHVNLYLTEFLEEIMDLYPLLIFVW